MRRALGLLALCVAFAVLHTWPLAGHLSSLSRLDNADTALNTWIVTWVSHAVVTQPLGLFDAPIFHPEPHTLAYSEHLLVPSLMGAPLIWLGVSPVTVYNLLAIIGLALSAWTMTLVMAEWTGSTAAGLVSGLLFAFNAHLLTRFVHLQALHVEFLPVALFAFDRVLRGGRGRDTALLAGAFVLQSLCSNYTMVFLGATLLVCAVVRLKEWAVAGHLDVAIRLAAAAVVSLALLAPFLWPYYVVARDQGLARSLDEVRLYSAGILDYLTTGGRLHYAWWSHRVFEGRTALFPGVVATALAVFAVAGPARRDRRVRAIVSFGVLGFVLSFGPAMPGYSWLHDHVPLLQGLRGAARWGFLALVAIAMLAGYGVAAIESRLRSSSLRAAVIVALAGLITIEALRAPMGFVEFTGIPSIYRRLAAEPGDVVVADLPLYFGERVSRNSPAMIGNTQYLRPMLNGYSGFQTAAFVQRAGRLRAFPAAEAAGELRRLGVTHIVLRVREFVETEGAERLKAIEADPGLTLIDEAGGVRLYLFR